MAYIKNWRDVQPDIAHLSAVHWGGLRIVEQGSNDDRDRLGTTRWLRAACPPRAKNLRLSQTRAFGAGLLHPERTGRSAVQG